ncbi:MAG: histidine phosphatase family protein [Desulfovibrionaceae bacterium]|jgi:probable phosphoglycerate mutase|nr:histidine phosphatase family protein [Desulfovibrionaceae bacterium]
MILLLRHAQALGGEGRYIGSTDLPLSDAGRAQARELGAALAGCGVRALFASPLTRARDTARAAAEACGLETTLLPDLAEIHLGAWEGRTFAEVRASDPEGFAARGADMARFRPPGGESFADVAARAEAALRVLATANAPCAAVAHAGILRALFCRVTGLPLEHLFRFRPLHACALVLESAKDAAAKKAAGADAPGRVQKSDFRLIACNCPPSGLAALLAARRAR